MPYTRNTRIKRFKCLHNSCYTAQVEYRYPLTKITKWIDIEEVDYEPVFSWLWMKDEGFEGNLPWRAKWDCIQDPVFTELNVSSLDWVKAVIDRYHELFDEQEAGTTVEYIKYP